MTLDIIHLTILTHKIAIEFTTVNIQTLVPDKMDLDKIQATVQTSKAAT